MPINILFSVFGGLSGEEAVIDRGGQLRVSQGINRIMVLFLLQHIVVLISAPTSSHHTIVLLSYYRLQMYLIRSN